MLAGHGQPHLAHDPEKHALGPRPDGWKPVFPRDKREAFARRSCSNKRQRQTLIQRRLNQTLALGICLLSAKDAVTLLLDRTRQRREPIAPWPVSRVIRAGSAAERCRDAPGAIFLLCRRSIARAAVDFGRRAAEAAGCGPLRNRDRSAGGTDQLRPEMAGAGCFRYQHSRYYPCDRAGAACDDGSKHPGPDNCRRRFSGRARARSICAIRAGLSKTAGAEAAGQTQNRKKPHRSADGAGRTAAATWLFCQQHLVAGALGEIRTPDPRIRSPMLYPAELRARESFQWGSRTPIFLGAV